MSTESSGLSGTAPRQTALSSPLSFEGKTPQQSPSSTAPPSSPLPPSAPIPVAETQRKNIVPPLWRAQLPSGSVNSNRAVSSREHPYVAAFRDAFVRFDYERANSLIPLRVREIPPRDKFYPLLHPPQRKTIVEEWSPVPGWRVEPFEEFDRTSRTLFLRGEPSTALPTLVSVNEEANSVTFRYKGEEFTLIVGHHPKRRSEAVMGPYVYLKSLNVSLRIQTTPCTIHGILDFPYGEMSEHLQALDDLVEFARFVREGDVPIDVDRQVVYRFDAREIRFHIENALDSDTRYVYLADKEIIKPMEPRFRPPFLTFDAIECRANLKRDL